MGIPWTVAVPSEVYTEYCSVTMAEYHSDPAAQMEVQLTGPRILHETYGLPLPSPSVRPDFTTYLTASPFGVEFEVFEDQVPAPRGHPITSIQEAAGLSVPADMASAGYFPQALAFHEYMKTHAPEGVPVGFHAGSQAPLTTAVVLRGEGFLLDVLDEPELTHRFLATLAESAIRQRELSSEINGDATPVTAIGFTDDYGGLLGPNLYSEFDVQYMLRIARHFGANALSIHTELVQRPHLSILQEHGFGYIDVGTDPYLSISDCRDVLEVGFLVQMKTAGELLLSTPDRIRSRYAEMVAEGAPSMLVELCRGVPPENIRGFIEVAREYE